MDLKKIICSILFFLLLSTQGHSAFRFVVCGDSRGSSVTDPYNTAVLGFINTQITHLNPRPAFVLFAGDMVYAGSDAGFTHNYLIDWKNFMDSTMDKIPYYPAIGNRDLYKGAWPPSQDLLTYYRTAFSFLPDNGPSSPTDYTKLVYSFEYGSGSERSLFVVLDAYGWGKDEDPNINFDNGYDSEQISWFAAQATSSANHKFVISHAPAFSPEGWPVDRSAKQIWEYMEQYGFDAFYCGHEHIYARWNIDQNAYLPTFQKITQIVTGDAGAFPDNPNTFKASSSTPIYFGYNFVVVDVDGNTIQQRAYKVIKKDDGSYYMEPLDTIISINR